MITKNIHKFLIACSLTCGAAAVTGCSDMLDTESERQLFDPSLSEKTDSVYYALGILQGIQQLADQYVFQGEMQGDLVTTTQYTDKNLRQLANFSATAANKYDSAYVYYRVINNCNYYIAHRDTSLRTGAQYVTMAEYVSVKAIRAWTYMQLARVYGKVPFYTEPLTQISHIDNNQYPELDMDGIVARLAPDLEQYSGKYNTPTMGGVSPTTSITSPSKIFFPVDVVLGDLYLESGQYDKAARHFVTYLTDIASPMTTQYVQAYSIRSYVRDNMDLPSDFTTYSSTSWSNIFSTAGNDEIITYVPMATSRQTGATTNIPKVFGYDYYSTTEGRIDEIQILPSESYKDLSEGQDYYYLSTRSTAVESIINSATLGDTRYSGIVDQETKADSTVLRINKNMYARILLYRYSTVVLHLAEAFNRLGMYDAAFAILKDGLTRYLVVKGSGGPQYISDATKDALQTTYPLFSEANVSKFSEASQCAGIHMRGSGYTRDFTGSVYQPGLSPYQLDTVVSVKMAEIAEKFAVQVGATKEDTINAVEDLLCDEYALELAFEGNRYFDLCRLARHKNNAGHYGANFGSLWLARKLAYKNPQKDLTNPQNWYLPFK